MDRQPDWLDEPERKPAAWTNRWLHELPLKDLEWMRRVPLAENGGRLERSRHRRIQKEYERRKGVA